MRYLSQFLIRRGRKSIRANWLEDTNKTRLFRHNKNKTCINSQRFWQHAQGLHKFGTDRGSDMKPEVDTRPIPKPEAIFMNN